MTKALQQLEQGEGSGCCSTTRRLYLRRRGRVLSSQQTVASQPTICWSRSRRTGRSAVSCALICRSPCPAAGDPASVGFYQAHPEVEIVSQPDVRRDMLRDGLIACCGWGILRMATMWRVRWEVALTTCASPGYLARYGAATLEDLQSHLAVNWVNSSSRQIMPRRFQTPEGIRQIAIPGKLVLDNSEVFTAAGLAGLGMLQGMRFFATLYRQRATGGVLPDFPAPRRPLSLLYPHRHLA